jgi:hypothetical protein
MKTDRIRIVIALWLFIVSLISVLKAAQLSIKNLLFLGLNCF